MPEERKEISKKYREPRTKRERALVQLFKEAGIELRIEDVEPGTTMLFFGPPPVAKKPKKSGREETP